MAKTKAEKPVRVETVGDERVEIYLDAGGRFYTTYHDHELYNPTLDGLLEAIQRKQRVKKTKLAIPATYLTTERQGFGRDHKVVLADVELTGVHGRTGEVLFRYVESGKSDRCRRWGSDNFFRRLTPAEKDKFLALDAEETQAQRRFAEYKKAREINAQKLIEAKVKEIEEKAS